MEEERDCRIPLTVCRTLVYNVSMKKKASASLHLRLSPKLKRDAERVFDACGIDVSTAIRLFFVSVVAKQTIPLQFLTVNGYPQEFEEELRTLADDRKNVSGPFSAGETVKHLRAL